jgi:hypothetical protein
MRSASLATSPTEALAQRATRRLAKRHLIDFSTYMVPRWYKPVRHQLYIADYLEQVALYIMTGGKEGIGRLMIFCPPRYGKSMQVSQFFPAWLLGKMPDCRIILSSYGAELAEEDSLIVRNYVSSKQFKAIFGDNTIEEFPVTLSEERSSRGNWRLADPHRGGVKASGVGGGIVGFGAHLLNINDPFKGREEAKSETNRKKVMTWYRSEAYMRLEEGGAVIVTHTRWDMEDLAGQLLQLMASDEPDADQWTVVMLPEIALKAEEYPQNEEQFKENLMRGIYIPMEDQLGRKPGEVLWPQKYPLAAVKRKHANALEFESAAQFQQMPRLEKGEIFTDSDFGYVDRAPQDLQWYAYVDLALGKTETSDFNTAAPVAMDDNGVLYIRDMLKIRSIDDFLPMLKTWMLDDREQGTIWGIENHGFQSQVVKDFMKDRRLAKISIGGIDIPWSDKVEGARPWAIRAKHGLVKLVRGSWNRSFIRTAAGFPGAAHDDEIDSVSGGNHMIADGAVGMNKTASSEAIVVNAEDLFSSLVGS